MNDKAKNIFFLGKGGVGKSTSSAVTAIHLALRGHKVLLVSMDPAHNLGDIFERKLSEKPVKVMPGLMVRETDIRYWVKKYLDDIHLQIKQSYAYLTAFNLEKYFDVIKYSPGIEEYALLIAYKHIRQQATEMDYLIFDMPPTALTVKFLTLPHTSLIWLENLAELRHKIIEKRAIITKIKWGKKEKETDKILNKLQQQIADYTGIKKVFENAEKTLLNLVMNTDKLSFSESELIVRSLKEFGLRIHNIYLNKYVPPFDLEVIKKRFPATPIQLLPLSKKPLIGLDTLVKYVQSLDSFIKL